MLADPRAAQALDLIRRHGPLSRSEFSQHLQMRPNSVGDLVAGMLQASLLREGHAGAAGPGRPRTPLEIDPSGRHLIGVSIQPDAVCACHLNLLGQRIGPLLEQAIPHDTPTGVIAARLLKRLHTPSTLAVGVSAAGFVDPDANTIVFSRLASESQQIDLEPLHAAMGDLPMVLDNDMHALASKWLLNHASSTGEDVLIVWLRNGAIGASVLIDGRPNRGCVLAANELGHTRFFVDTEPCYCGHTGCLERICSSEFLRRHQCDHDLEHACATYDGDDAAVTCMLRYLGAALANTANFLRPNRLVITGPLIRHPAFINHLQRQMTQRLLAPIADRMQTELWSANHGAMAEAAGCLALARIYLSHAAPAA